MYLEAEGRDMLHCISFQREVRYSLSSRALFLKLGGSGVPTDKNAQWQKNFYWWSKTCMYECK